MIYKVDALQMLLNVMPSKEHHPSPARQFRHIMSIFTLAFDDTELLNFNEKFTIKYDGDKYRILGTKMPMLLKPKNLLEFILDCNKYDIELTLKISDEKEASLFKFLYEYDIDRN